MRQGVILLGREGDDVKRPSWALDGSLLAFRYLKQLVPEFDVFLQENALPILPAPGNPTGADLLGARLVGRWKSGRYTPGGAGQIAENECIRVLI